MNVLTVQFLQLGITSSLLGTHALNSLFIIVHLYNVLGVGSIRIRRLIRNRRQRTDIEKYSFVNRTIQHWNQLPAEVLGILPCKTNHF